MRQQDSKTGRFVNIEKKLVGVPKIIYFFNLSNVFLKISCLAVSNLFNHF